LPDTTSMHAGYARYFTAPQFGQHRGLYGGLTLAF
jgi:hypothetical protein